MFINVGQWLVNMTVLVHYFSLFFIVIIFVVVVVFVH